MKNKYAALFLGWFVPGLGHIYAGKRWKGLVIFATLTLSWLAGLALGHFRNVYLAPGHYQFYAEMGTGLYTAVTALAVKANGVTPIEETAHGAYLANTLPIADLYVMIAGLLNYVVAANAFDVVAHAGASQEKRQEAEEQ